MTSPLLLHRAPGAGFEQPFEMLGACHERVERMLALLERLAQHLPQHGADEQAAGAARDVMRYFDQAAPLHHEDEERHVFPALRASGRPELAALAARLHEDHERMAAAWAALRAIPAGKPTSYAGQVSRIGRPNAARAIGNANHHNPFQIVVPCHRVVGASGALTGYAGGLDRKRWLLRHEGVNVQA